MLNVTHQKKTVRHTSLLAMEKESIAYFSWFFSPCLKKLIYIYIYIRTNLAGKRVLLNGAQPLVILHKDNIAAKN